MSTRELRFWPFLFGVYAVVWGLEALLSRLLRIPITMTLDITATDLAILGIVAGLWLLAHASHSEESQKRRTHILTGGL